MKRKTDNASLGAKVGLRRWLLGEMGITQVRVLDTCAGAGHIWNAMREHVTVEQWIRCDIKPRQKGTLRLAAVDALRGMALDAFNVIDIDTYGEPWEAYAEALPRLRTPTALFLTRGRLMNVVASHTLMAVAHLPPTWAVPRTPALAAYLDARMLGETWTYASVRAAAVVELPNVQYYALALDPLSNY